MRFLLHADFDRMGDFDHEGAEGRRARSARRWSWARASRTPASMLVGEPSGRCTDHEDRQRRRDGPHRDDPATASRRAEVGDAQSRRYRFGELRVELAAQESAVPAFRGDAARRALDGRPGALPLRYVGRSSRRSSTNACRSSSPMGNVLAFGPSFHSPKQRGPPRLQNRAQPLPSARQPRHHRCPAARPCTRAASS